MPAYIYVRTCRYPQNICAALILCMTISIHYHSTTVTQYFSKKLWTDGPVEYYHGITNFSDCYVKVSV